MLAKCDDIPDNKQESLKYLNMAANHGHSSAMLQISLASKMANSLK